MLLPVHWFATFMDLFALGCAAGIALLPPQDLGAKFFRIHLVIATGLAAAGTIAGRTPYSLVFVGALLLITLLSFVRLPSRVLLWFPVAAGIAWLVLSTRDAEMTVHLGTSAALLGSALMAMNLGHWYLNDASLPFSHLVRLCRFFYGAAIVKTLVSGTLLAGSRAWWWPILTTDFDGILVLARIGAGLVASIVFAWMALSCAKLKANQSATGILYVAVVFAIVGEVVSLSMSLGKGRLL